MNWSYFITFTLHIVYPQHSGTATLNIVFIANDVIALSFYPQGYIPEYAGDVITTVDQRKIM